MERLNKIFAEWAKQEKKKEFNLASEKVELAKLGDLKKAVKKLEKYNIAKELSDLENEYKSIDTTLNKLKSQAKSFVNKYGKFETTLDKQWSDYQEASKISNQIESDLKELGLDGASFTDQYNNIIANAEEAGQKAFKATQSGFKNYNDIVDLFE